MYQDSEHNIYCKPFCVHKTKRNFSMNAVQLVTFNNYKKPLLIYIYIRQIFFSVCNWKNSVPEVKAIFFSYNMHKSIHHGMQNKVFIPKWKKKRVVFLSVRQLFTCQSNAGNSSDLVSLVKDWKIYNETGGNCKMRTKRNVSYYVMLGIFIEMTTWAWRKGHFAYIWFIWNI